MLLVRCLLILLFCCYTVCVYSGVSPVAFQVNEVPLTTKEQSQRGVVGGEGFQLVMSIAYAASNPEVVYMGSDTSQIWKSLDGGASWSPRSSGYFALGSRSLFVHPHNENIVFSAGTLGGSFEKVGHKKPYQGIYLSVDGGKQWQMVHQVDFFKQDARGTLFAIDSRTLLNKEFTIYAGTYNRGLLISRDSGRSWQSTDFSGGEIFEIAELPMLPGTVLIASDQGLHYFDGKIQRKVGAGLPSWPYSLAVTTANPKVVYVALGGKGVYKSIDGAESFNQLGAAYQLWGSINDIEVSSVDADVIMFTKSGRGAGPYFSNDAGKNWAAAKTINSKGLTDGGGFFFPSPIAMHPANSREALTSSNSRARILATKDGGKRWSYSGSGYRGGRLKDVIFAPSGQIIFCLTDHGAWRAEIDGRFFTPLQLPRMGGRSVGACAQSGDTLLLAVGSWDSKHLLRSVDQGKSWSDTGLKGKLRLVKAHKDRRQVLYAGSFRSDDQGQSWQRLKHTIMAVAPENNDIVYAVMPSGNATQVLISIDLGGSWHKLAEPVPQYNTSIKWLEVDPFMPGRLYAATANGLWVLEDKVWQQRSEDVGMSLDNFGGQFVETVVAHPEQPGLVFAGRRSPGKGMGNGLFYSLDYGNHWHNMPDGELANTNIWSVNINPLNGSVYTGTSHGVYRVDLQGNNMPEGANQRPISP